MHYSRLHCTASLCAIIVVICFCSAIRTFATPASRPEGILHQYPMAGAVEVPPRTEIGVRAENPFDFHSFTNGSLIVCGSRSGEHAVVVHLSNDRTTAILHVAQSLFYGETVHVSIAGKLMDGRRVVDTFSFMTMQHAIEAPSLLWNERNELNFGSKARSFALAEVPLPPLIVSIDHGATPGTIYLANFGSGPIRDSCYLLNLNEHGTILKKRMLPRTYGLDFKLQPNGLQTYFDYAAGQFYALDSIGEMVDSFKAVNGYQTDPHELTILPDGGYALFGISWTSFDMSQFVTGGHVDAGIEGNVVQVFDRDKNVVLEWRGIDHYTPHDAIHERLTDHDIDFEHANSLEFDSEGNFLISNRHLCEISKVDGHTGEMIWRFGGAHNQFSLVGDSIWFSYQHAARMLANGHMTLFDNGNFDSVVGQPGYFQQSRALEYEIDTATMTASLVWQYHHTPEAYSGAMGYVQRLPNGNTMIGWGANSDLAITEVRPDNTTAFEMSMGDNNFSYRAFKVVSPDSSASGVPERDLAEVTSLNIRTDVSNSWFAADYTLADQEEVSLELFNLLGEKLATALSEVQTTGRHTASIDLSGRPSGVYYCVLRTPCGVTVRPISFRKQ